MKRHLIIAALLATAAAVSGCSTFGTSDAGTVTWGAALAHAPGEYPRIIIEDDTTSSWPIRQAVANWQVPVTFGKCRTDVNCVRFTQVSSLGGNRVGLTSRPVSTGPETVTIQLATNPHMNQWQTLQDVTHEFGHALGLGHDDVGVMHAAIDGTFMTPNAAELARIRSIYLR
jgi:hypothetical protein